MTALFVGIDVGKSKCTAAVLSEGTHCSQWRKALTLDFSNDAQGCAAFAAWLAALKTPVACICAEATGVYSIWFANHLHKASPRLPGVAIVNPAWIKGTAKSIGLREKTDLFDAAVIAVHALLHRPKPTKLPSPQLDELDELFSQREHLVEDSTSVKNRLKQTRTKAARKELEHQLATIEANIKRVDKALDKCVKADAQLHGDFKLLTSISGIGRILALAILAEFGDLRTWKREQVASYAGVYPRRFESGDSVRCRPHMIKGGGKRLRTKLFMGALTFVRYAGSASHQKLIERGKPPIKSIGAHMRKLLLLARAVVVSGGPFDGAKFSAHNRPILA